MQGTLIHVVPAIVSGDGGGHAFGRVATVTKRCGDCPRDFCPQM